MQERCSEGTTSARARQRLYKICRDAHPPRVEDTTSAQARCCKSKARGSASNTYVSKTRHPINPSQATKLRSVGHTATHNNLRAGGTLLSHYKTKIS